MEGGDDEESPVGDDSAVVVAALRLSKAAASLPGTDACVTTVGCSVEELTRTLVAEDSCACRSVWVALAMILLDVRCGVGVS